MAYTQYTDMLICRSHSAQWEAVDKRPEKPSKAGGNSLWSLAPDTGVSLSPAPTALWLKSVTHAQPTPKRSGAIWPQFLHLPGRRAGSTGKHGLSGTLEALQTISSPRCRCPARSRCVWGEGRLGFPFEKRWHDACLGLRPYFLSSIDCTVLRTDSLLGETLFSQL